MLHADHTHDQHPWYADLAAGKQRGLGLRLLRLDPDETAQRAQAYGATVSATAADKGHGWREMCA